MATSSDQMLTCTNCDQLSDQSWRIIVPVVHVHALRYEQKQTTTTREKREKTNAHLCTHPLPPPASQVVIADEPRSSCSLQHRWRIRPLEPISLSAVRAYKAVGRATDPLCACIRPRDLEEDKTTTPWPPA